MKIIIDREKNSIIAYSELSGGKSLILFSGKLGGCDFLNKEQQDERILILNYDFHGKIEEKEKRYEVD